jgi:hypothetical protein
VAAAGLVAILVVFNLSRQPPAVVADGGWPAARTAAARVMAVSPSPISLASLPTFKSADAMRFPLVAAGAVVLPATAEPAAQPATTHVVLCDALFEAAIGAACGGPAEDALVGNLELVDRFEAAPGRWVSVYH